jgi:hypothetical protein
MARLDVTMFASIRFRLSRFFNNRSRLFRNRYGFLIRLIANFKIFFRSGIVLSLTEGLSSGRNCSGLL